MRSATRGRSNWAPVPSTVGGRQQGYGWSICPSFAGCLDSPQVNHLVPTADVLTDAAHGHLPNYSVLTPSWSSRQANGQAETSQHNQQSMLAGGQLDRHGRLRDRERPGLGVDRDLHHLRRLWLLLRPCAPPVNPDGTRQGPRVPMVIVSPYAKAGSTDSTNATFASILAFTEHTFGLPPLAVNDAAAYDYANSFDYTQAPLPGAPLASHQLPPSTVSYLQTHQDDPDDDVT